MKKFLTILLSCLLLLGGLSACNTTPPTNPEKLQINYQNGVITLTATEDAIKDVTDYKVFVNDLLLDQGSTNTFDVARKIIDTKPIAYGIWKITAQGFNGSSKVIDSESFTFEIKELNQQNFVNVLKNEYKSTDYFLLNDDVYLYGRGISNLNNKNGYTTTVIQERGDGGNGIFFVKEPFTATLDGDGYALNFVVDEHINWSGSQLPFVYAGIFNEVQRGAVIKNVQVYMDSVYEVKSRSTASASFIFKHYGTIENVYVNQINRPMIRPLKPNPDGSLSNEYEHRTDNYIDKVDNKVAVISHAESGARVYNSVFYTQVYNVDGTISLVTGGAVGYSKQGVEYNNCAYISDSGDARFFNLENTATANSFVVPVSNNILFFSSAANFLSGTGEKVAGELKRTPLFVDFSGDALAEFGNAWSNIDGEVYLMERLIEIY